MKVLLITWDDPIPPGDSLGDAFREKGCNVSEIKYRTSIKVFQAKKGKISLEIKRFKPDLVFVMKGSGISPDDLMELRSIHNAKYFLWIVDDPIIRWKNEWPPVFREPSIGTYPIYDKVFVYDTFFVNKMMEMGLDNIAFLPCCFDRRYFPKEKTEKYEVTFYGTCFPRRERILAELRDYNLAVAGYGWEKSILASKTIPVDIWNDANLIYNQSKILLNIHHPQSVNGPNLRCFEIMATRRMMITEPLKDLKNMFSEGEEIVFYYDTVDLKEKINYYLEHDDERERIAGNAYNAVKRGHSIYHRAESILNVFKEMTEKGTGK